MSVYVVLFLWLARAGSLTLAVDPPDFRSAFAAALQRGESKIVIPPGTYRLAPLPGQKVVWCLNGLHDKEIVADGVTLVATKLTRAVAIDHCERVSIRGLTVDYDPLPFTQGRVVAVAEDLGWIDVKLHAGFPRHPFARIDVVDPETRYRKKGMPFLWGTKATLQSPDIVRVTLKDIGQTAKPGDLASLSTGCEPDGIPHAVSIERCTSVTLRNVTVHSAPGMGILEADGDGRSAFLGCRVVPGPRPSGAGEDRLLSTSWDAMQTKTVRIGPRVEGCEIRDAGDDSWSVQSADFMVLKQNGSTLVLASRDEYTVGVEVGDRLQAYVGGVEATVRMRRSLARAEAGLDAAVMAKLTNAPPWSEWNVSPRCLVVTLDRELPVKAGGSLFSPDRMGNGFAFLHNHIHSAGRVLIKAGGRIEGNLLDTPHALTVCPELPANAAAGIDGLVIRRNKIRRAGWFCPAPWSASAGTLSITAASDPPNLRPAGVFAHLVIEDNVFEECAGANIVLTSTRGAVVSGNRFVRPFHDSPPSTGASFHIPNTAAIWIAESTDLEVRNNFITEPGPFAGEPVQVGHGVEKLRRP